jgi:hypothetical protein
MTLKTYEFRVYLAPGGLVPSEPSEVILLPCFGEKAARQAARKLAIQNEGPIDLAVSGREPWNERYISTCSRMYPDTSSKITYWERLD